MIFVCIYLFNREQNLIRILTQKERVNLLREKLKEILKNSEERLNRPIEFAEVSITEIDATIQEIDVMYLKLFLLSNKHL